MGKLFSSLNFHHSISITHHSFFHTHLATSLLFLSLNFFTLFMGPTPVSQYNFFFSTQLTEANIYILKKKTNNQPRKKKKSVKKWSKVAAMGPLCVFNYNIVILLWIIKTENSQKLFSVSITHNSKIRELSDGNRVMETELLFAKQTFCYGSHHFWVMSYGNRELSYQKTQTKQPLSF